MTTSNLQSLSLSDSEEENTSELFASPSRAARNTQNRKQDAQQQQQQQQQGKSESKYDAEAAREAALKRELEGVRNINEVIEGVLSSLEVAKGNMDVCLFTYLTYVASPPPTAITFITCESHIDETNRQYHAQCQTPQPS